MAKARNPTDLGMHGAGRFFSNEERGGLATHSQPKIEVAYFSKLIRALFFLCAKCFLPFGIPSGTTNSVSRENDAIGDQGRRNRMKFRVLLCFNNSWKGAHHALKCASGTQGHILQNCFFLRAHELIASERPQNPGVVH